ncbi:tetratricopeptide repeat protein [Hymenobacter sp. RP-2-7]|uniref:Tetratricopeptide repeat protein n=1 Tax=Hymenobacter polaris TaxID=2682546 RepID=A0A7Y0AHB3_9BACT|nr:tetratricopeptide repeat-containing sensor histidine kinase [Hymenobacter polaris]NML67100.1 tetratricopeptide repeat protein [Hymenobacter polaris]
MKLPLRWKGYGVLLLLLLGPCGVGKAQPGQPATTEINAVPDSLLRLALTNSLPDTAKVNRLNAAAFALRINRSLLTRRLAKQAFNLAQTLGYQVGMINANLNLGYYYRGCNKYDSALYYTHAAMRTAKQLHRQYDLTRGLYNIARVYSEQGNYSKALAYNMDGLALARAIHNPKAELFQLIELGLIGCALGEYSTASKQFEQAMLLAQRLKDYVGMGHAYSGLGDLNRQQGRWSLAGYYYTEAAASYRHVFNDTGLLSIELSVNDMVGRQGNHAAARRAAQHLMRQARAASLPGMVARAQLLIARACLAVGQPDSARYYAVQSLATVQHSGVKSDARDAALILAQATSQLGQWQAAYRYQVLAGAYADSLTGQATRRRVAGLQEAVARSRQQARLRLLGQQERLRAQQQELRNLRRHQQLLVATALAALALALAAWSLWYYRRRENQRLLALRTRIAADLHDEVGSVLTQISMQSTLLREGNYTPTQQQIYLDQMVDASRLAARQLSDAVWSIDARYDSAASLLDRLRDHAYEVLTPAGLEILFAADPVLADTTIPLPVRQALYYIYKEALHNVVKHAQAQQIRVRLRLLGPLLELEVCDDGRGIAAVPRVGGQGLRNMRMRAAAVGGSVSVVTAADVVMPGVQLTARLPLSKRAA